MKKYSTVAVLIKKSLHHLVSFCRTVRFLFFLSRHRPFSCFGLRAVRYKHVETDHRLEDIEAGHKLEDIQVGHKLEDIESTVSVYDHESSRTICSEDLYYQDADFAPAQELPDADFAPAQELPDAGCAPAQELPDADYEDQYVVVDDYFGIPDQGERRGRVLSHSESDPCVLVEQQAVPKPKSFMVAIKSLSSFVFGGQR